jgi:mannose-6-phosphate isomerase-like protein (cupin superfamily)
MTAVDTRSDDTPTATPSCAERLLWSLNMLVEVKASAEDTGGALTVLDTRLTPAANPPLHVHHREDEAFLVLEGELAFFLGLDGTVSAEAGPGDFVVGPRDVPHRFEVRSPEARVLVLATPGGLERFFGAVGAPADAPCLPVPSIPDVERLVRVAAEHGLDIFPPPAA